MTRQSVRVEFDTDYPDVAVAIVGLLENSIPFMADNVQIRYEGKLEPIVDEPSDADLLFEAFDRARRLYVDGSFTAEKEMLDAMYVLEKMGHDRRNLFARPIKPEVKR